MPRFATILGQDQQLDRLRTTAARGRLPHALLFHGTPGVGKTTTAFALGQFLNCESPTDEDSCGTCRSCGKVERLVHPDLHWFFPVSKTRQQKGKKARKAVDAIAYRREVMDNRVKLGIHHLTFSEAASIAIGRDSETRPGSIAELRHESGLAPVEAKVKVFVVSEADRMTDAAQNSLLKVLEEPPPDNLLVLCTSNPRALLDTILSRCQHVRFRDLDEELLVAMLGERAGAGDSVARLAAALGQGSLTRAADLAEKDTDVVALRDAAVELITLGPSDPRTQGLIDGLAGEKDRGLIERVIDFGLLWHADLLRLLTASDVPLANRDREDDLRARAADLDVERVRAGIAALEAARAALRGNVYMPLVLHGLVLGLAGEPATAR